MCSISTFLLNKSYLNILSIFIASNFFSTKTTSRENAWIDVKFFLKYKRLAKTTVQQTVGSYRYKTLSFTSSLKRGLFFIKPLKPRILYLNLVEFLK